MTPHIGCSGGSGTWILGSPDVRGNHGRPGVLLAELLLYGSDVDAGLETCDRSPSSGF